MLHQASHRSNWRAMCIPIDSRTKTKAMSRSGLSKIWLISSVFASLALAQSASGQQAQVPDLSGGEGGWVHARGARFAPVPGSASPVRQDPAHPFTPGQGRTYQIGDLSNPNLKPWVKEVMKNDTAEIDAGKIAFQPEASCLPTSIPIMYALPSALQIVQTPREVIMFKEGGSDIRHIYLDVPHSANPKPSWYGESVGHYEGDTLVIDTIGIDTRTVLDAFRTPHTEKLHIVERWRTINRGKGLEVTTTVDDPESFYQPWSTLVRDQRGQEPFLEVICAESNDNFGLFDFHMPAATKPDF
jgi:hypothetical protein